LTDKNKNNTSVNNYLFENKFAYVTSSGEVKLKENKFFEERTLTTVEPDSVEKQVKTYEEAFSKVQSRFDELLNKTETENFELDSLKEKLDELIAEAGQSEAIGDFESLIEGAKQKIDQLKAPEEEKPAVEERSAEKDEEKKSVAEPEETKAEEKEEISEKTPVQDTEEPVKEEITEESSEASSDKKTPETDENVSESVEKEETEEAAEVESAAAEPEKEDKTEEEIPEVPESTTEEAAEKDVEEDEKPDESPIDYYKKLAEKAETLMELKDWSYATVEFENLDLLWSEGPDADGDAIKPYREKIDTLREQLEEKKRAHYEQQQKIRQENLEKKKDLLKQFKEIIDEEKWTHTRDVARIKNKWEQIKPIPAGEAEKLDAVFNEYLTTFDEHKVDRLVKQKQQEEDNLTGKLVILEKMETFIGDVTEKSDWQELDKKMDSFSKQFRKIGRIPAEKNQEVWDRFHRVQDTFHSMRFKYDKKYRKDIEKFLAKKKKLIDEAEALIDAKDIAKAARKVNKLHRRWKKTGNLPQKDENEMWDRFKAATDAFNDRKSENIDKLREQEEQNYEQKLGLINKAEELKDSEEWSKTHSELQKLMDEWKNIGPVPRRKSGKIWKKFKEAMDHFYNRRREFFKEVKEERKDNLKEKEDVLEKLKELQSSDNPIEAVNQAKPLQEEFKKSGYVPIKHKNRLWKEYREICDVIYDRFRAAKSAAQIVGKENVENFTTDDLTEIKSKQDKADKLRKEISKLSGELIQMKESLSYFKPSSSGSSVLDDVKKRIDKAEEEINKKEEKLQSLEIEIDKIKRSS
jgi:hypothetical protein